MLDITTVVDQRKKNRIGGWPSLKFLTSAEHDAVKKQPWENPNCHVRGLLLFPNLRVRSCHGQTAESHRIEDSHFLKLPSSQVTMELGSVVRPWCHKALGYTPGRSIKREMRGTSIPRADTRSAAWPVKNRFGGEVGRAESRRQILICLVLCSVTCFSVWRRP